jgi:hypothetical protein
VRSFGAQNVNNVFTDSLSFQSNKVFFYVGVAFIIVTVDF